MQDTCCDASCDRLVNARGMCEMHYRRWYRTVGKASGVTASAPAAERFLARVRKTDGCWLWTGSVNANGYGSFGVGRGAKQNAHRWYWEHLNGKASSKLHLDHLCRNKLCVNPSHMELVSHGENLRRGKVSGIASLNAAKAECLRGHPFNDANTRYGSGGRHCRACDRERLAKRRRARRQD